MQDNENIFEKRFNKKYTFETFVIGDNNYFAYATAFAVGERPGEVHNPLYIYGASGVGKTHLLHAVGNYILQQNPKKKIKYLTAQEFVNKMIDAIQFGEEDGGLRFQEWCEKCDVLMIDDIQFLVDKEATIRECFGIFDELYLAGKQIIVTSNCHPEEIMSLGESVFLHYKNVTVVHIGTPNYDTRMKILRKNTELLNMNLEQEVLSYIATHIKSDIRQLEGSLNRLVVYTTVSKEVLTLDDLKRELASYKLQDVRKEIIG